MKKMYTTLLVLFAMSLSFAQPGSKGPMKVKNEGDNLKKMITPVQQSKSGPAEARYNYPTFRQTLYNQTLTWSDIITESDSNVIVLFNDGNDGTIEGRAQFYGWGQVYDLSYFMWNDPEVVGEGQGWPDMNLTASYNIDSIEINTFYRRYADIVHEDVRDTLIVNVVTGLQTNQLFSRVMTIDQVTDTFFRMYYIKYDPAMDGPDVAGMAPSTVNRYTYVLSQQDSSLIADGSIYAKRFKIPMNITNLTGKQVAVTWTFKRDKIDAHYGPGGHAPDAANKDSITKYSQCRPIVYPDPDPLYSPYVVDQQGNSSPVFNAEHKTNLNTALYVGLEEKYDMADPSAWYYRVYNPTIYWTDAHEQDMSLYISCNDCQYVSVKEMENKKITVRPNPATSNFTVDLLDDSIANLQLFNLVGQVVASQQVNGQATATINVSNLNSGVYMLKVMQNGKAYTSKVVVK